MVENARGHQHRRGERRRTFASSATLAMVIFTTKDLGLSPFKERKAMEKALQNSSRAR